MTQARGYREPHSRKRGEYSGGVAGLMAGVLLRSSIDGPETIDIGL